MSTKKITWGIHKELHELLTEGDNFTQLFYKPEVAEKALKILLAERDEYGNITGETILNALPMEEINDYLNQIGDYFTDFFFLNQQRTMEIAKKMNSLENNSSK